MCSRCWSAPVARHSWFLRNARNAAISNRIFHYRRLAFCDETFFADDLAFFAKRNQRGGQDKTVGAEKLARETISGSGELLRRGDADAATLRENVTSPGGTPVFFSDSVTAA